MTEGLKIYTTSKRGADGYVQETIKYGGPEKFRKYLESKGYEGIETLDNNETVIFPSAISKLKTESQLKKIWESANKK